MDNVSEWSTRIAEQVVPAEADLAPLMAYAYIGGGEDREDLFRRERDAVHGAFGPELVVGVFPWLLAAIQHVGPELTQVLEASISASDVANVASNTTGAGYYVVGAIGTILNIRGRKEREEKKQELLGDGRIKEVHDRLTEVVGQTPGLDRDQADLLTYRLLKTMLEDPPGARRFTEELQKVP